MTVEEPAAADAAVAPAAAPDGEAAGDTAAPAPVTVAAAGAVLRRRRTRVPGGRRNFVAARYTDEELEAVTARAAAAGWEVSSYVAEAALHGPVRTQSAPGRGDLAFRMSAPERQAWIAELMAVRRIVGATSNNINQLARVANATGETPVEVRPSLAACGRAMDRLSAFLDALDEAR